MPAEDNQKKEFVIPTRYKQKISAQLSWPTGALELTKVFATAPQLDQLQLIFRQQYPVPHQGKWPASFPVVELQYANHRSKLLNSPDWEVCVYPVPRNIKVEIKEQMVVCGFKTLAAWLHDNARFSGHAGNLRYTCVWNSESKMIAFESHDYVLPEKVTKTDIRKR